MNHPKKTCSFPTLLDRAPVAPAAATDQPSLLAAWAADDDACPGSSPTLSGMETPLVSGRASTASAAAAPMDPSTALGAGSSEMSGARIEPNLPHNAP
mmetsp:Transcript_15773/g.34236  ORF Transcript_15773/g.34236 Transcript_15773/m.34236 type:complete len:98 (+) Transcript_15773:319-612(+)